MKSLRTTLPSVLLLAAIWLAFECWISWAAFCDYPPYQAGRYESPKEYPCQFREPLLFAAQRLVGWWRHSFDDAESYIALFTAILAFGTITLWLATKRLVEGAGRTAERQLRAYVGVESIGFQQPVGPFKIQIVIVVKNFGRTPAYDYKADIRLSVRENPA